MGKILALLLIGFLSYELVEEFMNDQSGFSPVVLAGLLLLLAIVFIVIVYSYFHKTYKPTFNTEVEDLKDLLHGSIESLFPAISISKMENESTISESFEKARSAEVERVLVRICGRDYQNVNAMLVISNKRVLLYRTHSLGIAVLWKTIGNLIDKIPFGGIIMWPFEGIAEAFGQIRDKEYKSICAVMLATDEAILEQSRKGWKLLKQFTHSELLDYSKEIQIRARSWNKGLIFSIDPQKLKNVFKSTEFHYQFDDNLKIFELIAEYLRKDFTSEGFEVEIVPGKHIRIFRKK